MEIILEVSSDGMDRSSPELLSPSSQDCADGDDMQPYSRTPPSMASSFVAKSRRERRERKAGVVDGSDKVAGNKGRRNSDGGSEGDKPKCKPGKSKNKRRDKMRDEERRWKSLETTAYILGIDQLDDPSSSSQPPGGSNTRGPTAEPSDTLDCFPRTARALALKDLPRQNGIHVTRSMHDMRSWRKLNGEHSDGLEGLQIQMVQQHKRWMMQMEDTLNPNSDRKLARIRHQAERLGTELLGPAATPQLMRTSWSDREKYLDRLCHWQERRVKLSGELRYHRRRTSCSESSSSLTEDDVWSKICEVAFELARLGRDCASSVGEALKTVTDIQELRTSFSIVLKVLRFLLFERDNILLDPPSRSSRCIECQEKCGYMADGAFDMLEGALEGAQLCQSLSLRLSSDGSSGLHCSASCETLLYIWAEVPSMIDRAQKIGQTYGSTALEKRYCSLVGSLLDLTVKSTTAYKHALDDTPERVETEEELSRQSWLPFLLSGLKSLSDEVGSKVDKLVEGQSVLDNAAVTELRAREEAVFRHLCDIALSVAMHVKNLEWATLVNSVYALDMLEEMATKVLQFLKGMFRNIEHWERCRVAETETPSSIVECSESCMSVVLHVRALKDGVEAEETDNLLGMLESFEFAAHITDQSSVLDTTVASPVEHQDLDAPLKVPQAGFDEASPFWSSYETVQSEKIESVELGTAPLSDMHRCLSMEVSRAHASKLIAKLTRGDSAAMPSHTRRSMSSAFPGIQTVTDEELKFRKMLGKGSFGQVWSGSWDGSNDAIAVKVIESFEYNTKLLKASSTMDDEVLSVMAELKAFRELQNHDNIVTFHDVFWFRKTSHQSRNIDDDDAKKLIFVMEYCGYGNLYQLIAMARQYRQSKIDAVDVDVDARRPSDVRKWAMNFYEVMSLRLSVAQQVASAVQHMHQKGFIHRDLTSYNVLLTAGFHEYSNRFRLWLKAKVCDFGFTRKLQCDAVSGMSESRPSFKWQAPEVLSCDAEGEFSTASDVYSFGVILWEIITLNQPWEGWHDHAVAYNVHCKKRTLGWEPPHSVEPMHFTRNEVVTLVNRCWSVDPSLRPSMTDVVCELAKIREQEEAEYHKSVALLKAECA